MDVGKKDVFGSLAHPRFMTPRLVGLCLFGLLIAVSVPAEIRSDNSIWKDEKAVEVSLITILPGESLYSSFGHTALRVIDRGEKTDLLYNYGQSARPFDIAFLMNLVIGRMEFMVDVFETGDAVRFYKTVENRTIIEQPLNVDQEHAKALKERLEYDSRPANRLYNYRFFTDNCTTRVWLLLKEVVMQHDPEWPPSSPRSLRQPIEEILANKPTQKFLISLFLGPAADRPRDLETSLFLPDELMDQVGGLWIQGLSGRESFVSKPRLLYKTTKVEPTGGSGAPLLIFLSLLVLSGFLVAFGQRARSLALIFDAVLFGIIFLAGLSILLLWVAAGYQEVGMNTNHLWATPLPLVGLVWDRVDRRRRVPTALFALESIGAITVAVFGGLGGQAVSPEVRIMCAIIFIRCAAHMRLPPSAHITVNGHGIEVGK